MYSYPSDEPLFGEQKSYSVPSQLPMVRQSRRTLVVNLGRLIRILQEEGKLRICLNLEKIHVTSTNPIHCSDVTFQGALTSQTNTCPQRWRKQMNNTF